MAVPMQWLGNSEHGWLCLKISNTVFLVLDSPFCNQEAFHAAFSSEKRCPCLEHFCCLMVHEMRGVAAAHDRVSTKLSSSFSGCHQSARSAHKMMFFHLYSTHSDWREVRANGRLCSSYNSAISSNAIWWCFVQRYVLTCFALSAVRGNCHTAAALMPFSGALECFHLKVISTAFYCLRRKQSGFLCMSMRGKYFSYWIPGLCCRTCIQPDGYNQQAIECLLKLNFLWSFRRRS